MIPDRWADAIGVEMPQTRTTRSHDQGFACGDLGNPDGTSERGQRQARHQSDAVMDGWRRLVEAEHLTFVPAEPGGFIRPGLGEGFEAGCLDSGKPAVRWFGQRFDAVAPVGNLPCNQLVEGLRRILRLRYGALLPPPRRQIRRKSRGAGCRRRSGGRDRPGSPNRYRRARALRTEGLATATVAILATGPRAVRRGVAGIAVADLPGDRFADQIQKGHVIT